MTLNLYIALFAAFLVSPGHEEAHRDSSIVVVSLDSMLVHTGETFAIAINIRSDSLPVFSAYQFTLAYDPFLLAPDSVDTSNTLSVSSLLSYYSPAPGTLNVAVAKGTSITQEGLLLNLLFRSLHVEGTAYVRFDSFQLQEGTTPVLIEDGSVEITAIPTDTTRLKLDSVSVATGEVATTGLYIKNDTRSIFSGTVSFSYDPHLLTPVELQYGNTLMENLTGFADYSIPEEGRMDISFALPEPASSLQTPLLRIALQGPAHETETTLILENAILDEIERPVLFQPGVFRFTLPFTWGDVDGDEQITIIDARLILAHILGKTQLNDVATQAAEVSGNRHLSSFDAALILMYIYNIIDCFPADPSCDTIPAKTIEVTNPGAHNPFKIKPGHTTSAQVSLVLDASLNPDDIFGLDVTITTTVNDSISGLMNISLPDGWIHSQALSSTKTSYRMAGPTPLPAGTILTFPEETWHAIDSIDLLTNESNRYYVTPSNEADSDALTAIVLYPHPFAYQAWLTYTLPEADVIEINVYDTLGRRVRTLFSGNQQAGRHELLIDGTKLAPGLYSVHLKNELGARYIKNFVKQ